MKYYSIQTVSDPKIIGVNNGIMQVEICDDNFLEPMIPLKFNGVEIDMSEEVKRLKITCIKKLKKVIMTDFLSFGPDLTWCPFFVTRRTAAILSRFNTSPIHLFPVAIEDSRELNDYSLALIHPLSMDVIDFEKSVFFSGSEVFIDHRKYHDIPNKEEYIKQFNENLTRPEHIVLNSSFNSNLDLFYSLGFPLYISERLKLALESNNITGVSILDWRLPTIEC